MTTRFSLRNDAGPTNTAAISLWQKFSQLQQSIEECVKERKEIDAKIDASQMKQSDLRQLRRENLEESRVAERKLNEIEQKIAALQNYFDDEIQSAYGSALLDKRNIEIKLSQWKEYKASALQLFLDRSAKFRLDCKRLKMTSETLGLIHASSQSWMYVTSCDRGDDMAAAGFDHSSENVHPICPTDDDAQRDDPLSWNIPKTDYELLELVEQFKREWDLYEVFRNDLDTLKGRKTEGLQHEQTLTERATLMQKQLDRILNDCNDLESQMLIRSAMPHLGQSPAISGHSTQQEQEHPEKPIVKRARTNPYSNRSSNSASNRRKALQSIVLGSTAVGPPTVSPASLSDSTSKAREPSRFQHFQFVSDTGDAHFQQNAGARENPRNDDRGISSGGHSSTAFDDDDDDDLFSFIGLRK